MTESRKKGQNCPCQRAQLYRLHKRKKEQCKRKRQTFVYNPEEEVWHEPYMRDLRKEFSDVSILCDSKIELPWKDIALPATGMKIRQEGSRSPLNSREGELVINEVVADPSEKESSGTMALPWKDLVITETVQSKQADPESCDSTLEIPWDDLALEKPMEIRPSLEDPCPVDDVEIPWADIVMPRNIVIESQKKKKHPSSKYPHRTLPGITCIDCKVCSKKIRNKKR